MIKPGRSATAMMVARAKIEGTRRLVAIVTIMYVRGEILLLSKNPFVLE
jgi:hypothetical protein